MFKRCIALAAISASVPLTASGATVSDLYGTWTGLWHVDATFDDLGPLPGPYPTVPVVFSIRAFDPGVHNYGTVDIQADGPVDGVITGIKLDGNDFTLAITYPATRLPYPTGFVTATLIGASFNGRYDEVPTPALVGWIGWKGTLTASAVPEPSVLLLLPAGLAVVRASRWKTKRASTDKMLTR